MGMSTGEFDLLFAKVEKAHPEAERKRLSKRRRRRAIGAGRRFALNLRNRVFLLLRLDPLLFFKPAHPAFQARFRQTACSASHSNLWFTSPHTMSLMRSYVFSGFRYLSPMIRHVLTLRIACST